MDSLPSSQIEELREELLSCKKPLIFFHDDADGLSSFLLFYRFVGEGKGVVVKKTPRVTDMFVRKVEEYCPDKIFILDLAMVDQEFLDAVNVPVVWVDHHTPLERKKVKYFNPRILEPQNNIPCSRICYDVVKNDLWIGMVGIIADWHYPKDLAPVFSEKYPDLLPPSIQDPEVALFESGVGRLANVFSFLLKGPTSDALKGVKVMTRIDEPYEILNQSSPKGKFIYKKFEKIDEDFKELISRGVRCYKQSDRFFVFVYCHDKMSFSQELANYFLHKYPDKIIVVGRKKSGSIKASLRSRVIELPHILDIALKGVDGFGGGHEYACGLCVSESDFPSVLDKIRAEVEKHDSQIAKHDSIASKHDLLAEKQDGIASKHDSLKAKHDILTEKHDIHIAKQGKPE